MSPYAYAAHAAEHAKRAAQVHPANRIAYARRVAYRALRASCPHVPASWAWSIAKTAANAQTLAYA